jgi:alanine racemase
VTTTRTPLTPGAVHAAAAARLEKAVDCDAVRANVAVLRAAGGGRRVMAVVKGDAYGLGARAMAGVLLDAGADALAVDTVAEGIELREHGITAPVLVMDVDVAENAGPCIAHGLMPAVATPEQIARYASAARRREAPVTVWLRANVGFNRFGPRDDPAFDAVTELLWHERAAVRTAGVFAHLSSSAQDPVETAAQAGAFRSRAARVRALLGPQVETSLAATHGLMHPAALPGTDWIRPGIGLYGLVQPGSRELPGWQYSGLGRLRPAVTVRARVLDVVTVTRDEGLGYDRSAVLPPGRRVASVAIGFSRGLAAAGGTFTGVLHGRSCPMAGRPGMDCTQFDVTEVPGARPGDWMTFIGPAPSGGVGKSAEETGRELGRSLYEVLATFRMPVRLSGTVC